MEGNLKWGCGITRVSGRREVGGMWEFFVRETGCKTESNLGFVGNIW